MKKCPPGKYYCLTDKKCKKIPKGWHVLGTGYLSRDNDNNDQDDTKKTNGNGQEGESSNGDGGSVSEDLRKWFGKGGKGGVGGGGWDRYNTKGERIGKCAREPGEPKPKCLSKEKAAKMSKSEIGNAVKRKRKADPVADRKGKGGKPKMVSNNIGEDYTQEEERYCPLCDKRETRSECSYGEKAWDKVSVKDEEYSMVRRQLDTMLRSVEKIQDKVGKGEGDLESWVQAKITKAADYIDTAADYMSTNEAKDPCWDTHKQVGMKKKGNKMVPNCVPKEEVAVDEATYPSDFRNPDGSKRAVAKKKYGRPQPQQHDQETDKYGRRKTVDEGAMPAAIDPKAHRSQQRAAKVRNLAKKGATEGERSAAKGKTKGPDLFGENLKLADKILLEMEAEVLNEKNVPTNPSLWSKMKSRAKAKFDVYPSAYANGWAAKEYKKAGGGWKSVKEDVTITDANGNPFVEFVDLIKPEPLVSEQDKKCSCDCGKTPCVKCGGNCHTEFAGGSAAKPGPDNNYVKPMGEEIEESVNIKPMRGKLLMVLASWRGKSYSLKIFFPQTRMPNKKEIQTQIQKVYPGARVTYAKEIEMQPGEQMLQASTNEDWQKVNKSDKTDGMSAAAVKAYRRENPGSKLKTAVTGDPKPGSKDAKRRKSFCARSKGQQDMHNIDCSKTPDKPVCKARRRWKC